MSQFPENSLMVVSFIGKVLNVSDKNEFDSFNGCPMFNHFLKNLKNNLNDFG
jgi:hypothetical protein